MRFWIVGGGTGGHVYPALAATQALQAVDPDAQITWVGTESGMEARLVEPAGLPFLGIPAGGVHGVALHMAIRNGWKLMRGLVTAWRAMRRERPDAILTTGGYVSGPVTVAAARQGVPVLIYVPDIEPAQSIKSMARMATRIAVTVEDSRQYLPADKVVVTGYPLGERITRWDRARGRERLGFAPDCPVVLVFGGSRGARSLNRAVLAHIEELVAYGEIIHVSGTLDWPEVEAARAEMPAEVLARYHAFDYLHDEMGAAMAAADLVICRAGASVLGESPYFGLPSVLVPYPYAWRYQRVNADWLAQRGAAMVVEDAELADRIVPVVRDVLGDAARRAEMAAAARSLAQPGAARHLAELLHTLGRQHAEKG